MKCKFVGGEKPAVTDVTSVFIILYGCHFQSADLTVAMSRGVRCLLYRMYCNVC